MQDYFYAYLFLLVVSNPVFQNDPCTAVETWRSVYRKTCTSLLGQYKSNTFMLEGAIYNVDQYIGKHGTTDHSYSA